MLAFLILAFRSEEKIMLRGTVKAIAEDGRAVFFC